MTENKIYVQVKRHNQSFCFLCESSDTGLDVKERIVAATVRHHGSGGGSSDDKNLLSSTESIRLLHADTVTVLDDTEILSECDDMKKSFASTGVVVLYVVAKDDSTMEWESVDVVSTEQEPMQLLDEVPVVEPTEDT